MTMDNFFMQARSAIKAGRVPDSALALEAINRREEAQLIVGKLREELRKWGSIEKTFTSLALDLMGAPKPAIVVESTVQQKENDNGVEG
jgi:hypothetical protein